MEVALNSQMHHVMRQRAVVSFNFINPKNASRDASQPTGWYTSATIRILLPVSVYWCATCYTELRGAGI